MSASLLIEIGCEEIPARMIGAAAAELEARLLAILSHAGVSHGTARNWGGTRRLAVSVSEVAGRLDDKVETILGPPASAAFAADGRPTPAAMGFAKKQGIEPGSLARITTDKGVYAGFTRRVVGRSLGQVLANALPQTVESMPFPKTMRWGTGEHRWVRPVHWVVALHGGEVLEIEILGALSGRVSQGHRFLSPGPISLSHAEEYVSTLREAHVFIDPSERRARIHEALKDSAQRFEAAVIRDEALLDEITNLVEWPSVVVGRFDEAFLDLPREIRQTTLRHHQKAFSMERPAGAIAAFLSVANTDGDVAGHVRRGNEWVVGGRLADARFFWQEDRRTRISTRLSELSRITFHKKLGSYAEKTFRIRRLAQAISEHLGFDDAARTQTDRAATLAKADLATGLVGEFPELQGVIGGLLLLEEQQDAIIAAAVADHYKPLGPSDSIPRSEVGSVVAVADKLDTIVGLVEAGEVPTGSRDPFGLRRAASGVIRISLERQWNLSINDLWYLSRQSAAGPSNSVFSFLTMRMDDFFHERGFTRKEFYSVARADGGDKAPQWSLPDLDARLAAIRTVRGDSDFQLLVRLTTRVANINKNLAEELRQALGRDEWPDASQDPEPAARELAELTRIVIPELAALSSRRDYGAIVQRLKSLAQPVDRYFRDALVIDESNVSRTTSRLRALKHLESYVLTKYFDLRELAGDADRGE